MKKKKKLMDEDVNNFSNFYMGEFIFSPDEEYESILY